MNRIKLRTGVHFWLQGREYAIEQQLAGGEFLIREIITSVLSSVKETALIQLIFRGELTFEATVTTKEIKKKKDALQADFTQFSDALRYEAKRKYRYIELVRQSNITVKTQKSLQPIIERVAKEINDPSPPSWVTLYRWLKTYEKAGQDIRSLVPKYENRGDYRPKLERVVTQIIVLGDRQNLSNTI